MIAPRIRLFLPLAAALSAASLPGFAAEPLICKGNHDPATPTVVEHEAGAGTCEIRDGTHRLTGGGDLSFAIRPGTNGHKAVLEAAMGTDGGRRTGGFQVCLLGDGPSGAHCRREFMATPGTIMAIVETAAHRMILTLNIANNGAIGVSNGKICPGTGPEACS